MTETMSVDDLGAAKGRPVMSSDGVAVGDVDTIYYEPETRTPTWIGVATGFITTKRVAVPVAGARFEGDRLHVPYTKEQVMSTPSVGDEIDVDTERVLADHYGVDIAFSPVEEETEVAPALDASPADGAEVTRSEEELLVEKRRTEAGRVRVRKWVEAEPVTVDVELERETVRIHRESINEPVEAEIGEAEIEVRLTAEEAVVDKQTIAKERIVLEKDVEREVETITDELRKERVEIEHDEGIAGDER